MSDKPVTPDELRSCASGDWRRHDTYYEARRLLRAAADRSEELEETLDGLWTLVDVHLAECGWTRSPTSTRERVHAVARGIYEGARGAK